MEKYPWTASIFIAVLFTVQLGALSLILAVLVDGTQRVHADVEDSAALRAKQFQKERAHVLRLLGDIDADGVGAISLEKFVKAFDASEELATFFALMDIHRQDLEAVFSLLKVTRVNGSDEVSCADLVDELLSLKMLSPQRMLLYNNYTIQNKIADGVRSIWESTSTAHGIHGKQLKHVLDVIERRDSAMQPAPGVANAADASSDGIAHESKTPRPRLADAGQGNGRAGEQEVQRCMDRLRRSVEAELSSIASTVATSLREAAVARPRTPRLPPATTEASKAFAVVDEVPPMSSSRRGAERLKAAVIAEQVQKDLLKFQERINTNMSSAADKLGGDYPETPLARDYQIALVQLQLRLNEGLSLAMSDVMTKIHPAAQDSELAGMSIVSDPQHIRQQEKENVGGRCGIQGSDPCCGKRLVIVANE